MESFIFAVVVVAFWVACFVGYVALHRRAKAEVHARKVQDARILADMINRDRNGG
jgi:hypothetical protein